MHTLFDFAKKLPDTASVEMLFDDNNIGAGVTIKSDKVECSLPVMPPLDFPAFSAIIDGRMFKFNAQALRTLLVSTRYAISNEESRYYLNGVFIDFIHENGKNLVRAVATDVHRLSMAEMAVDENCQGIDGIIIPKKTVNELIKLLETTSDEVMVHTSSSRVMFEFDNFKMSSKLIDGKFPDYGKAISADPSNKVLEVDTKALFDAVNLVTTVSFDKTKAVKFNISHNKILLSVYNNINGFSKASQELGAIYDDSPAEIAFNSKYVMDALTVVSGPKARFAFANSGSAVVIHDASSEAVVHVIMPMQI